ncbi:MAG: hypothetical protein M3O88_01010 [Actinomycetota bacterium]|nr:hypothetical protein [Actinomycetota bacterium]
MEVEQLNFPTTLRLKYDPEQDLVQLERSIADEGRRAARELYQELARLLEAAAVQGPLGVRQRLERRWVATVMGRVRLQRYRVRKNGKTFHPLDQRLQLGQAEASPALLASASELAALGLTYRQAAAVLSHFTGAAVAPQTVWRMLRSRSTGSPGEP